MCDQKFHLTEKVKFDSVEIADAGTENERFVDSKSEGTVVKVSEASYGDNTHVYVVRDKKGDDNVCFDYQLEKIDE